MQHVLIAGRLWRLVLVAMTLQTLTHGAGARETLVTDQAEYAAAVAAAEPGDTIVLADGEWSDFPIVFEGEGTAAAPITLSAETPGQVAITGRSNLRLGGRHLVVRGLVFRDGHTPTNEVIAFRTSPDALAHDSRVTETVIDRFNNPERFETDFWVMLYGQNNRFDHNHLVGKGNAGVTMAVRLDARASQENRHRIDHNYFGPRDILGANGGETLRIGTSKYSLTDSRTVLENNVFDRCNGELEIISIKAGRNVVRGNLFIESRGTLTLRHGNDNLLENNVFLGNGIEHTGGIRVINKRQTVRNNYLSGLTGYRFGGALVVMNGVPNSPINRYHQVEGAVIERNTIIDSDHVEFAAGSDEERSAVPIDTRFANNLIVHRDARDVIAVHDDVSGIAFDGNVVDGVGSVPIEQGFDSRSVRVTQRNGLAYPGSRQLRDVGVSRDLEVLPIEKVGVSWYPKAARTTLFDHGQRVAVEPGYDTLTRAVAAAGPGDVLELTRGTYRVSQILLLKHPVSVVSDGDGSERPTIVFERSTLFEILDGGGLTLRGLDIDGSVAPDAYGNSVVRTTRYSMLRNYELHVEDCSVHDLNTNHSFHFLKTAQHTFADRISIRASDFRDVSGHILVLDREIDDLGIYNAEYVAIVDSRFHNVGGAIASVYRGGTDESTFGPHVTITGTTVKNVGHSRRNRTHGSLHLHGVQVVDLAGNAFVESKPVQIVETVGDPITRMADNVFDATAEPIVRSTR